MKHTSQIAIAVAATLVFAAATVLAQPAGTGPGMMHGMGHGPGAGGHGAMAGPTGMLTKQDAGSAADMGLVMNLVHNNTRIRRTVTKLPNGIKTTTESDDPKVAQDIKTHVASMSGRLKDGREFNLFSTTLPVIFDNAKNIKSVVEMTDKGAIVTRTATDAKVVAALQAHAGEVTELVQEGPAAFHRGMNARMAMGPGGLRTGAAGAARQAVDAKPAATGHAH
ncbi:MAG: hypothetical protein ABL891_06985 [Burkholderiales bacterium]